VPDKWDGLASQRIWQALMKEEGHAEVDR